MKSRGYVAGTVLVAWAAGVAVYARREANRSPAERLVEVAMRIVPGVTWLAMERDGRQVGFTSITVDTLPRELLVTEYVVTDDSTVAPGARRTSQTIARFSRGLALRGFERLTTTGIDSQRLSASVIDDSLIAFTRMGREQNDSGTLTHHGETIVPAMIPLVAILRGPPKRGADVQVDFVDPVGMARRRQTLHIAGESTFVVADSAVLNGAQGRWVPAHGDTVRAWRLTSPAGNSSESDAGGTDMWVDQLGQIVSARGPGGIVLRRAAFELVFENWRLANPSGGVSARAGGAILSSTLLAGGALEQFVALDTLRVRVRTPTRTAAFGAVRSGGVLTSVRLSSDSVGGGYSLPMDEASRRARAFSLRREPRIEIDDPAIVRLATRLRGRERDPARVVAAIVGWVRDSVAKDAAASGSAAETLAGRRGDCGEHARLFVGLARAAGIPARGAAGLLYAGGKFYYHAWAEVYLGRRFVGVDPMLGQLPADASHLRWMSGSLEAQTELMRVLARLELDVRRAVPSAERGLSPPPSLPPAK